MPSLMLVSVAVSGELKQTHRIALYILDKHLFSSGESSSVKESFVSSTAIMICLVSPCDAAF